jgi:hypothetical protein
MGQHQPYIALDSVINDYLNESEQGVHKYFKVWHLAFRGFENLGIDAFYRIKTLKLAVADNFTVQLPQDYINWSKVGVLNDRGEIIPLNYNNKLTHYAAFSDDRLSKTQDNTLLDDNLQNGGWYWYNYWNGYSYQNIYGVPSGSPFVGSFKVDTANGLILLDESFQYDYLMLEYVASPQEGQEYYLPFQFREALIAWLWWKDKRAITVNRGQVGVSRDLRNDFYNERRKAIAQWRPIRIYEGYQASQEFTRLAIRT